MHKVLLIDDDPSLGRVLCHYFKKQKYDVTWLQNARDASDLTDTTGFDVILLDIRLGNQSGLDILRNWQENQPATPPVIVMTGENTPSNAIEAMGAGAFDYLVKPFELSEARMLVEKAIGDREPVHVASDGAIAVDGQPLIGRSPTMQEVYKKIGLYGRHEGTVLIQGESGVGKELVARAVHVSSNRRNGAFVAINMSAIPDNLLESELFGYEKGAFTGADKAQPGKFRQAEGGTLFLDEIGDMPMALQAKLLRVLQEREVTPIGSLKPLPIDVRIVAATQVDLQEAIKQGQFRQDLYFRLNVLPLDVPALSKRKEDIPDLVQATLLKSADTKEKHFDDEAMAMLVRYNWPGNVRELQNVVERVALLSSLRSIGLAEMHKYSGLQFGDAATRSLQNNESVPQILENLLFPLLDDLIEANSTAALEIILNPVEKMLIERALQVLDGNQIKVAELLGLNRNTLRKRVKDLEIDIKDIKEIVRERKRRRLVGVPKE